MVDKRLFIVDDVPDTLLANLETRDVALWVRSLPKNPPDQQALVKFLGLPWRLVLMETYDADTVQALEAAASFSDPMTRKRGFAQIIDSDPSRIELPQRCLPVYLLNGRESAASTSDFANRLRRMTMLEDLRRSAPRNVIVISGADDPVPPDVIDLWSSSFRANLYFVSDAPNVDQKLEDWLGGTDLDVNANLVRLPAHRAIEELLAQYERVYPPDRSVIRVRDARGMLHDVDVTEADEPERPILERYALIQERDLTPLLPEELAENDFVGFFRDPQDSWRPYAAGLPWLRDPRWLQDLEHHLKRLDTDGPEQNCVAYISGEPGAGGTTLARALAWRVAQAGYPVLVAKPLPFVPDALPIVNFLNRVLREVQEQAPNEAEAEAVPDTERSKASTGDRDSTERRYEAPWVIVFEGLHWDDRESDLLRFRNEMEKSGRPVCLLLVTGTVLGLPYLNTRVFRKIAELNHSIPQEVARDLGRHLNQFLRVYGRERQDYQWDQFHQEHTVRYLEGQAAFWVMLSFWIQGQYNLFESIQEWMYRSFKDNATDESVRDAVLEIAALSSARFPMPDGLLPESRSKWPVSHLLEDSVSSLGALGLVRIVEGGQKHWALIHDILGRFLINALFYDFPLREELGFADARDAEHLRFLLLRRISQKALLGERAYRSLGEDFATTIFKIDPDHGHGSFASLWREVLTALDNMPQSLRDTSRIFRHHTAVSRRRITTLDETFYSVTLEDKEALLKRAIDDIIYALTFIEFGPGSESNLNLYNSLANAYFDLADVETARNAAPDRIAEVRRLANEATRRAFDESPTNSFVIETYVKNLLQSARHAPEQAVELCLEALGILFSALTADESAYRASQLGDLADRALEILFRQPIVVARTAEPSDSIGVLLGAWKALTEGQDRGPRIDLSDIPEENLELALAALAHPAGRGNMQVIRMSYDITCIIHPNAFKQQLELVEQLQATNYRITPQLSLENAILLFQNLRATEGDKAFRLLRNLWRDSEHFVQVPERVHWLRAPDGLTRQTVHAIVGSDRGNRAMAHVEEFGNALVPFRPEEHGIRDLTPRMRFVCHVSFGHNGPFLRPVTAQPSRSTEPKRA